MTRDGGHPTTLLVQATLDAAARLRLIWRIAIECVRHPRGTSVTYDDGKTWKRGI